MFALHLDAFRLALGRSQPAGIPQGAAFPFVGLGTSFRQGRPQGASTTDFKDPNALLWDWAHSAELLAAFGLRLCLREHVAHSGAEKYIFMITYPRRHPQGEFDASTRTVCMVLPLGHFFAVCGLPL